MGMCEKKRFLQETLAGQFALVPKERQRTAEQRQAQPTQLAGKMLQHELIFIKKVCGTARGQTATLCRWKGQWEEDSSRENASNWCFGEKANAFTLSAAGGFFLLQAVCGS